MKPNVPARRRARFLAPVIVLAAVLGLASCSKSDSSDSKSTDGQTATTEASPSEATTDAAATDAPPTEATATEAVAAPVTEAAAATEATAPVTEASASGTEAGGSDAASVEPKTALIGQLMAGMSSGAAVDPKEVACVSAKISEKELTAFMAAAGAGGGMSKEAAPALKAIFSCKPKGLTDSFITETFTDIPADVTADQKSCLANKIFDFMATNDEVMTAMVNNASTMPAQLKTEGAKIIKDCVPPGASQDKLIAEMNKD
jgi:hypothetical protein